MQTRLGIIADDNTGASDAAGMLTERGIRTVLILSPEALAGSHAAIAGFDAAVIGTQNRSIHPRLAADATRVAIRALRAAGIARFQIKYCSTFDSTPQGNIGPTLDAALDELKTPATVVCPALPVNGRTVYMGHLFVGRQLLSESPLRNHPLNPMTDASIVRWLARQTSRTVALVELPIVRSGPAALRQALDQHVSAGAVHIVVDAIDDADLVTIAQATADWPLVSGGSGITAGIAVLSGSVGAAECRSDGAAEGFGVQGSQTAQSQIQNSRSEIRENSAQFGEIRGQSFRHSLDFAHRLAAVPKGTLVVSGSQSLMTRRQFSSAMSAGFRGIALDVPAAVRGQIELSAIVAEARPILASGGGVVIHSPADGEGAVRQTQSMGASLGLDTVQTGQRIAAALGALARQLVADGVVGRLVVSGGETSGVVCLELGLEALEVGLPLSPGVPFCFPLDGRNLLVVLKSGNFGDENLYRRVWEL